jgi:uncharacterized protein YaeQ
MVGHRRFMLMTSTQRIKNAWIYYQPKEQFHNKKKKEKIDTYLVWIPQQKNKVHVWFRVSAPQTHVLRRKRDSYLLWVCLVFSSKSNSIFQTQFYQKLEILAFHVEPKINSSFLNGLRFYSFFNSFIALNNYHQLLLHLQTH